MTSCSVICPLPPVAPTIWGPLTDFLIRWQQKAITGASLLSLAAVSLIVCLAHGFYLILEIGCASFWRHLLLIVGLWWVNIGLKFGNGNGNSQEGYANKRWNPHFYEPLIIEPLSYMIFPCSLTGLTRPPQSRTPKKKQIRVAKKNNIIELIMFDCWWVWYLFGSCIYG